MLIVDDVFLYILEFMDIYKVIRMSELSNHYCKLIRTTPWNHKILISNLDKYHHITKYYILKCINVITF